MDNRTVVNLGVQQFDKLIEENKFYIDKTGFISEWWETGADVTLITRPRRFGKTLNMSMVECFFSNRYTDRGDLFEGLSVWEEKTPEGTCRCSDLRGTFPFSVPRTDHGHYESCKREYFLQSEQSQSGNGNLKSVCDIVWLHGVGWKNAGRESILPGIPAECRGVGLR